jgi:hypothetical protein
MECVNKKEFVHLSKFYMEEVNKEIYVNDLKIRKIINLFEFLINNYKYFKNNTNFISITNDKIKELCYEYDNVYINIKNITKNLLDDLMTITIKLKEKIIKN